MKQILKRFCDIKVGYKLVIFVYLCALLLFILLTYVLYTTSYKIAMEEFIINCTNICTSNNQIVNKERFYMLGVADYYSTSSELQSLMIKSNNGISITFPNEILSAISKQRNILSITFYNTKGYPIGYASIDNSKDPVPQNITDIKIPFRDLINDNTEYAWQFLDKNSKSFYLKDYSPKLCLWYAVKKNHSTKIIGVIAVTIDSRKLLGTGILSNYYYNKLLIVDEESNSTVVNYTNTILKSSEQQLMLNKISRNNVGNFIMEIDSKKKHIFYSRISNSSLVICYITQNNFSEHRINELFYIFLISILMFLIVIFPVMLIVSNIITKPLQKLKKTMLEFADGNFNAQIKFKYNDEIGELGKVFNKMVKQQHNLLNQTVALNIKKKDAELSRLQAQINPHFLFNILNSIQWHALRNNQNEIANMVYSLAQVFRISLNHGNKSTTVKMEINLLSYYLNLQKYRYGKRIKYKISCSNETLNIEIPKLIIQPLVENSVVHGMEKINKTVNIVISTYIKNHKLIIIVEDNGKGIPNDVLKKLPYGMDTKDSYHKHNRFAIKNIFERLKLTYGNEASFEIESKLNYGTKITISIPLKIKKNKL